jgi:hypothetical protein
MMEVMQGVYKISGIWDQADLGANVYLLALKVPRQALTPKP